MGKYGPIIEDFYTERSRILNALAEDQNKHIVMRLIGALAFRTHCPQFGYIQDKLGRVFTDFDFVAYPKYFKDIIRVLTELGYVEDKQVTQLFGDQRMIFHDPAFGRHIDVFYNALDFCHNINFIGRLEAEADHHPAGGTAPGKNADRPDKRERYHRHGHAAARTSIRGRRQRNHQS